MSRIEEHEVDMVRGVYRRIYAGFRSGKRICAVTLGAEAWFWRVDAIADDFGNMPAGLGFIYENAVGRRGGDKCPDKCRVTRKQSDSFIRELLEKDLIRQYEVDDESYFHVTGFIRIQPAGKNGKRHRKVPPSPWDVEEGASGGIQVNPDLSCASHSHTHSHDHSHTQSPPTPSPGEPAGFVKWWDAYPDKRTRKHSRSKCLARWTKGGLEAIASRILSQLQREKASSNWAKDDGRFIPNPLKWLERAPWESRPAQQSSAPAPKDATGNGSANREELEQREYLKSLPDDVFKRFAEQAFGALSVHVQAAVKKKGPLDSLTWRGETYRIAKAGGAATEPPSPNKESAGAA